MNGRSLFWQCARAILIAGTVSLLPCFGLWVVFLTWPRTWLLCLLANGLLTGWICWRIVWRTLQGKTGLARTAGLIGCGIPLSFVVFVYSAIFLSDAEELKSQAKVRSAAQEQRAAWEAHLAKLEQEGSAKFAAVVEQMRTKIPSIVIETPQQHSGSGAMVAAAEHLLIWDMDKNKPHQLNSRVPWNRRPVDVNGPMLLVLVRIEKEEVVGSIHVGSRGKGHSLIRLHAEVQFVDWPAGTLIARQLVIGEKPDNTFSILPNFVGDIDGPLWKSIATETLLHDE